MSGRARGSPRKPGPSRSCHRRFNSGICSSVVAQETVNRRRSQSRRESPPRPGRDTSREVGLRDHEATGLASPGERAEARKGLPQTGLGQGRSLARDGVGLRRGPENVQGAWPAATSTSRKRSPTEPQAITVRPLPWVPAGQAGGRARLKSPTRGLLAVGELTCRREPVSKPINTLIYHEKT